MVPWSIGALTNSPVKLTHYMGVWRGVLAAGEALCFGLDAAKIPYVEFAGAILTCYSVGIVVLYWLSLRHVEQTCYFLDGEEGAVIPNYIVEEKKEWSHAAGLQASGS